MRRPSAAWARVVWALGLVGALAAGGTLVAEEPPVAEQPPVAQPAFRDLGPLGALREAPLVLHVRLERDGRVAIRSAATGRQDVRWVDRGRVDLAAADDDARRAALRGLCAALASAVEEASDVDPPSVGGARRAQLVVDAEADAPWHHVQQLLALAAAPPVGLQRIVLLTGADATPVALDLPRGAGPGGAPPIVGGGARELAARWSAWVGRTKTLLELRPSWVVPAGLRGDPYADRLPQVLDGGPVGGGAARRVPFLRGGVVAWVLPWYRYGGFDEAWDSVRWGLEALLAGEPPPRVRLEVPHGAGDGVRAGDVLPFVRLAHDLGVRDLRVGAGAPLLDTRPLAPSGPGGAAAPLALPRAREEALLTALREAAPGGGHLLVRLEADLVGEARIYAAGAPRAPAASAVTLPDAADPGGTALLAALRAAGGGDPTAGAPRGGAWRVQVLAPPQTSWESVRHALVAAIGAGWAVTGLTLCASGEDAPVLLELPPWTATESPAEQRPGDLVREPEAAPDPSLVIDVTSGEPGASPPRGARVLAAGQPLLDLLPGPLPAPGAEQEARRLEEQRRLAGLVRRVREASAAGPPPLVVEVRSPTPEAGGLAFRDVLLVLRALQDGGAQRILLQGPGSQGPRDER